MAQIDNYVNPLSGTEVVEDVLGQIRKRLATDCNLRATDGYTGGYSGTVKITLNLHAVKISEVEMEVPIVAPVAAPAVEEFPPEDVEPVEVDEVITIPVEENLVEVRSRTEENKSNPVEEPVQTDEPETETRQKRKYTRRTAPTVAATAEEAF